MQLCETLKGTGLFPSKRDLSVRRIPYEGDSLLLSFEDGGCHMLLGDKNGLRLTASKKMEF